MIPSGIFVVTTARDAVRAAYVGSWIQQAAFDPPSITIAMNQRRPLLKLLEPGRGLGVHILGRRQAPLYARFERGFSLDEDPFVGIEVDSVVTGAPILVGDVDPAEALTRTYVRGRDDFKTVLEDPTSENLHEWRKRVKDLWYQEQLLEEHVARGDEGAGQGGQEAVEVARRGP